MAMQIDKEFRIVVQWQPVWLHDNDPAFFFALQILKFKIGLLHHLARKYCKVKVEKQYNYEESLNFTPEDVSKLSIGSYILYAWKIGSDEDGHFIALVDGQLKCDKVLKKGKCNIKPLTISNVRSMFYGNSISPILVWKVVTTA